MKKPPNHLTDLIWVMGVEIDRGHETRLRWMCLYKQKNYVKILSQSSQA